VVINVRQLIDANKILALQVTQGVRHVALVPKHRHAVEKGTDGGLDGKHDEGVER